MSLLCIIKKTQHYEYTDICEMLRAELRLSFLFSTFDWTLGGAYYPLLFLQCMLITVNRWIACVKVNTQRSHVESDKPIEWLLTDDIISEYWEFDWYLACITWQQIGAVFRSRACYRSFRNCCFAIDNDIFSWNIFSTYYRSTTY